MHAFIFHIDLDAFFASVAISRLSRPDCFQPGFFSQDDFRRWDGLYQSLNRIRSRFGFSAIISGRAINLLGELKRDFYGFHLRTPSLTR